MDEMKRDLIQQSNIDAFMTKHRDAKAAHYFEVCISPMPRGTFRHGGEGTGSVDLSVGTCDRHTRHLGEWMLLCHWLNACCLARGTKKYHEKQNLELGPAFAITKKDFCESPW